MSVWVCTCMCLWVYVSTKIEWERTRGINRSKNEPRNANNDVFQHIEGFCAWTSRLKITQTAWRLSFGHLLLHRCLPPLLKRFLVTRLHNNDQYIFPHLTYALHFHTYVFEFIFTHVHTNVPFLLRLLLRSCQPASTKRQ